MNLGVVVHGSVDPGLLQFTEREAMDQGKGAGMHFGANRPKHQDTDSDYSGSRSRNRSRPQPTRWKPSEEQKKWLMNEFHNNPYPDVETKERLADELNVKRSQVSKWFQHKRESLSKLGRFHGQKQRERRTKEELAILEAAFAKYTYPSGEQIEEVLERLGGALTSAQVKLWFKHKRNMLAKKGELELKSQKRNARSFTTEEEAALRGALAVMPEPDADAMERLAKHLQVQRSMVALWFQQQRQRDLGRNGQERELAAGQEEQSFRKQPQSMPNERSPALSQPWRADAKLGETAQGIFGRTQNQCSVAQRSDLKNLPQIHGQLDAKLPGQEHQDPSGVLMRAGQPEADQLAEPLKEPAFKLGQHALGALDRTAGGLVLGRQSLYQPMQSQPLFQERIEDDAEGKFYPLAHVMNPVQSNPLPSVPTEDAKFKLAEADLGAKVRDRALNEPRQRTTKVFIGRDAAPALSKPDFPPPRLDRSKRVPPAAARGHLPLPLSHSSSARQSPAVVLQGVLPSSSEATGTGLMVEPAQLIDNLTEPIGSLPPANDPRTAPGDSRWLNNMDAHENNTHIGTSSLLWGPYLT